MGYYTKTIIILLLLTSFAYAGELQCVYELKPTDWQYELCNGTYVKVDMNTGQRHYYVNGTLSNKSAYETEMSKPPKKTKEEELTERVRQLEEKVAQLDVIRRTE